MERKKWVVGNWKMNGSLARCATFLEGLKNLELNDPSIFASVNIGLCLPYIFLNSAASHISNGVLKIGAQDLSIHSSGAFTGEVSGAMLVEAGAKLTLIGHSERRQYHLESDEIILKKVKQALASGLVPLVCVGETLEERKSSRTEEIVARQIKALFELSSKELSSLMIAYEPVWAIGTGISATSNQAQEVHYSIRNLLKSHSPDLIKLPILYGGSVNEKNASSFFSEADIDGGLLGGASLQVDSFFEVIRQAKHS